MLKKIKKKKVDYRMNFYQKALYSKTLYIKRDPIQYIVYIKNMTK